MMKRLYRAMLIIVLLGIMISCEYFNPPNDEEGGGSSSLSPPDWVQGTWEVPVSAGVTSTYTFTPTNLVIVTDENGTIFTLDFSDIKATSGTTVTETTTTTTYEVVWTRDSKSQSFTFTKDSSTSSIAKITIDSDGKIDEYTVITKK